MAHHSKKFLRRRKTRDQATWRKNCKERELENIENEESDAEDETNADMLMMIKGLWDAHTKKEAEEKEQKSKYL